MQILNLISHVFQGEIPESPFQYVAKFERKQYKAPYNDLGKELADFLWNKIYSQQYGLNFIMPSEKFNFLDFHLAKFKGDQLDFLYFIEYEDHFDRHRNYSNPTSSGIPIMLDNSRNKKLVEEWISMRKQDYYNYKNLLSKEDSRIKGLLSKDEIRKEFLKSFYVKNEAGDLIMELEDIDYLLRANFRDFNPIEEIKKFKTNENQAYIYDKIYRFYYKHRTGGKEAYRYGVFLKQNFVEFEGIEDVPKVVKNFSKYTDLKKDKKNKKTILE